MSSSKSPIKAVKKAAARVKARSTRRKTQSKKAAKALTTRVRQAMPKAAKRKKSTTPAKGGQSKARRAGRKKTSILSVLEKGLDVLGQSALLPVSKGRGRRKVANPPIEIGMV